MARYHGPEKLSAAGETVASKPCIKHLVARPRRAVSGKRLTCAHQRSGHRDRSPKVTAARSLCKSPAIRDDLRGGPFQRPLRRTTRDRSLESGPNFAAERGDFPPGFTPAR